MRFLEADRGGSDWSEVCPKAAQPFQLQRWVGRLRPFKTDTTGSSRGGDRRAPAESFRMQGWPRNLRLLGAQRGRGWGVKKGRTPAKLCGMPKGFRLLRPLPPDACGSGRDSACRHGRSPIEGNGYRK